MGADQQIERALHKIDGRSGVFVSMTDNKLILLLSNANTNRNGRCSWRKGL